MHEAIADALDPSAAPRDYYRAGPSGDDGGYLQSLVTRVQRSLRRLAGYEDLLPYFREAAAFYAQMQTFKHFPPGERETALVDWYERNRERFEDLDWHEFACAAGSQFQVYGPLFVAFSDRPDLVGAAYDAYFPEVAALHVLLDAFIDQAEDAAFGELNFAAVYDGPHRFRERVREPRGDGRREVRRSPQPRAASFRPARHGAFLSHAPQSLRTEPRRRSPTPARNDCIAERRCGVYGTEPPSRGVAARG